VRTIPLGGKRAAGRVALVDDQDYDLVIAYRWHVALVSRPGRDAGPYAQTNAKDGDGRFRSLKMHNLILGCKGVDHINSDGLDNQRHNLRPATTPQNNAHVRPQLRAKTSLYKGVYWDRQHKIWRARIGRPQREVGRFASEEDAARAYDAAALALWGEFALLNFPA